MIQPIMKNVLFLGQKSEPAAKADMPAAQEQLRSFGMKSIIAME